MSLAEKLIVGRTVVTVWAAEVDSSQTFFCLVQELGPRPPGSGDH